MSNRTITVDSLCSRCWNPLATHTDAKCIETLYELVEQYVKEIATFREGPRRVLEEMRGLRDALRAVAKFQADELAVFRSHGIRFEDIGVDPKNWQHIAFSLYSDLCEVETIARNALTDQHTYKQEIAKEKESK